MQVCIHIFIFAWAYFCILKINRVYLFYTCFFILLFSYCYFIIVNVSFNKNRYNHLWIDVSCGYTVGATFDQRETPSHSHILRLRLRLTTVQLRVDADVRPDVGGLASIACAVLPISYLYRYSVCHADVGSHPASTPVSFPSSVSTRIIYRYYKKFRCSDIQPKNFCIGTKFEVRRLVYVIGFEFAQNYVGAKKKRLVEILYGLHSLTAIIYYLR